jgi:hypothetical protein
MGEKRKDGDDKSAEIIDPELTNLLAEAEGKDPLPGGDLAAQSIESAEKPEEGKAEVVKTSPLDDANLDYAEEEEEDNQIEKDIKEILSKFDSVSESILHNFACDRVEIEDAINEIRQIFLGHKKPPQYIVEGLVSALRLKVENNSNAIKMLDAYAKIISATKGTNVFSQTNTNINLETLLSQNIEDEDDED